MLRSALFVFTLAVIAQVAVADCGSQGRQVYFGPLGNPIHTWVFEQQDSWTGVVGRFGICGGCAIYDLPGGKVYNDKDHPLSVTVTWGDGQSSSVTCTSTDPTCASNGLSINSNGDVIGSHKYSSAFGQTRISLTASGQCANPDRNWHEVVDNDCNSAQHQGQCTAHPTTVEVFAPMPPSAVVPTTTIKRHTINQGAIAIFLGQPAPASGMKISLSSVNRRVMFTDMNGKAANPAVVVIPAGHSSANFDLDATLVVSAVRTSVAASSAQVVKTATIQIR